MTAQAVTVVPVPSELAPWNTTRESLRAGWVLGVRELRTSIRTPASRSCCATDSANSRWRSVIGISLACTGLSQTGNAPP